MLCFYVKAQKKSAKELNDLAWELKSDYTDSAMLIARNALAVSESENNFPEKARSEKIIGVLFWFKNEMDSALNHYEKSLRLFKDLDDKRELANLYNNISIVFNRLNLSDTSLYLYQQALAINLQLNDSAGVGRNYVNIGVLYGDIGDDQSYLRYSKLALIYTKGRKDILYSNMAGIMPAIYGDKIGLDSAIFYYRLALKNSETDRMRARILLNIGPHFMGKGLIDSASFYLEKGITLIKDKSTEEYAKAIMDQGRLLSYDKKYSDALEKYFEVSKFAEKYGYSILILNIRNEIAATYSKMGNWKNAYEWERKHQAISDSLKNLENRNHLATLQEQFEYEQNQRKISELREENLLKELALVKERNTRNIILFIGAVILFIIGVIWILYRRKEERTRHLLELKKLEIEQRMLRSQMNPHFIFNALNSIQSFITTNNTYEAEVFMSKFSMLVRKILENSTYKTISLEEEISTLKLYLELEKSRFEERFDFHISKNADDTLPIPPMLLQPFIENAIIHGMKEKIGKGNIYVRFKEEEDFLICEVEDDGVGRKNSSSEKTHKSLATALTNDRISYFNEASNVGEFNLKIVDIKDESGNPSGTKVILKIPLAA